MKLRRADVAIALVGALLVIVAAAVEAGEASARPELRVDTLHECPAP